MSSERRSRTIISTSSTGSSGNISRSNSTSDIINIIMRCQIDTEKSTVVAVAAATVDATVVVAWRDV